MNFIRRFLWKLLGPPAPTEPRDSKGKEEPSPVYTNWTIADEHGTISISADREGGINPALNIRLDKETGAVFVSGSPDLQAVQSTGKAMSCVLELFECIFSAYPNSIQVPLDQEKEVSSCTFTAV